MSSDEFSEYLHEELDIPLEYCEMLEGNSLPYYTQIPVEFINHERTDRLTYCGNVIL